MKKQHPAQLRDHVASTRKRSVSAFFNTRLGFLVFTAAVILAVVAAPALGRISRDDRKAQASIDNTAGVIDGEIVPVRAEGGPCQYAVTYGTHTIVPGITDTGNHCAWCDTMINLPFPFVLYDQTFNAVMVNSSGRLDFVCNNELSNYTETCLPAPPQ